MSAAVFPRLQHQRDRRRSGSGGFWEKFNLSFAPRQEARKTRVCKRQNAAGTKRAWSRQWSRSLSFVLVGHLEAQSSFLRSFPGSAILYLTCKPMHPIYPIFLLPKNIRPEGPGLTRAMTCTTNCTCWMASQFWRSQSSSSRLSNTHPALEKCQETHPQSRRRRVA